MPSINILYENVSGRIRAASINAISPVPLVHTIVVKTMDSVKDVFEKRIDPMDQSLVDKDFLELAPSGNIRVATVQVEVLAKKDGETKVLKEAAADNDAFRLSTRAADLSFQPPGELSFFNVLTGALSLGAAQFKLAVPPGPSEEFIVVKTDLLRPLFAKLTYVV